MIIFTNPIFAFLALLALTNATPLPSCTSPHNPIILLHGMSSNASSLSALSSHLISHNYCVYALTYGAKPSSPSIGGLLPIAQSSAQIASFIHDVHAKTHAHKIDLIGHSEGAFQALYTAKFGNVSHLLEHIIATAPATHGTNLNGVYDRAYVMGEVSREILGVMLQLTGNPVLDELGPDGPAVKKLNEGPITQKGNKVTVIASKTDGVVTPPVMSFVREEGVANMFVQDYCPESRVRHEEEGLDENVWNLILNSLQDKVGRKFKCIDKY